LYKQGTRKFFAFSTGLKLSMFNTALVNVALSVMFGNVALSTLATATVTTLVDEIVDASSAVKTARRRKLSLARTQVFHEHNILGLSKNFAMTLFHVPER